MAALPTIPNVIRAAVVGRTAIGTPWANVLHFDKGAGGILSTAITAFQAEIAKLYSNVGYGAGKSGWASFAHSIASVDSVRYTPLFNGLATQVFPLSINGTGGSDAMPSDTAMVISWRADSRGPRYRGRSYWAAPVEGDNDSTGHINSGNVSNHQQAATSFIAACVASAVPLQIASYKYASAAPVVTASVNNVWDRQRRRAA
jgi:hypothetical protein